MMMRSISVGAPQPWPPPPSLTTNATDGKQTFCTPGICTNNCLQWCGSFYLPPPPPFLLDPSNDEDDSSSHISPLMVTLIAVLAAAFLILFYYTVLSRFCRTHTRTRRRRRTNQILNNVDDDIDIRIDPMVVHDPDRPGLDDSFIRQITVFKYRREDGLIDGSDCAVCLSEFKEEENLRLMPNCEHAFHIPCIDTWLKSHSSCPLCRSTMNPVPAARPNDPNPAMSVAAMQVQRSNDVVLVVWEVGGEVIVCHEEEEDGSRVDSSENLRKGEIHRR